MPERSPACARPASRRQTDRVLIPPVKAELGELRLGPIRNDILDFSFRKPAVFSGAYRKSPALLDLLARKYSDSGVAWVDIGGERFVAGPTACARSLKNPSDPQMEKVAAFLRGQSSAPGVPVYAIYLLGIDESDENRQAFLLLGQNGLLLRDNTLASCFSPLETAEFSEEGLVLKNEGLRLDWAFDERFLEYVKEIYALKFTWPQAAPIRHPFMDLAGRLDGSDSGAVAACIDLFIDLAASRLRLENLLLLENLVALFRLPETYLLARLEASASKNFSKNDLVQRLNTALNLAGQQYREIFFLFLIEFCGDLGGAACRVLLDILRRDKFAGREFVDVALRFYSDAKEALGAMAELLTLAPNARKALVAHKQYLSWLGLEILNQNIGATSHESSTGS